MAVETNVIVRGEVCSETKQPRDNENDKLSFNNHYQDLHDVRWRDKRRAVVAKANYKCQHCGAKGRLDVHHLYYIKGKRLWQHPYKALVALCRDCHTEWHQENRLEFRERIWSSLAEYQPPKKRKIYYVTKGRKTVAKEVPYTKPKRLKICKPQVRTPLEKHKDRIRKRTKKGLTKPSFAQIPNWRLKLKKGI